MLIASYIQLGLWPVSGYSKGFGFVRYATLEEAEAGIKGMDGKVSRISNFIYSLWIFIFCVVNIHIKNFSPSDFIIADHYIKLIL